MPPRNAESSVATSGGISIAVKSRGMSGSFAHLDPLNQGFDGRQERFHDYVHAFSGRMDAVGQVQTTVSRYAFEKKRNENQTVLPGEVRIYHVESCHILLPEITRSVHARKQDLDIARFQPRNDLFEIFPRGRGRNATERIVRAEFENDGLRSLRHRPIKAGKT